ncbi:quinone oxidoreductase family protein [Corynebacterium halotolerans]|uniref:Alcohol dehydrogenase GroES domain-containing protein n=1 Tax=Corynebacterium halotolerans YIM 70093 = DSM 44683 TaxID=1121362 RepID=M1NL02_9CORY|nr:NADP-dependent oxidoreductase [Corynebacterium halotolerans]AGF72068.1 alcohol dehydrogenase GroES domain-containing protein [Corynebacterium halotolerans YIM 70093 = DSM 44683]
MKAIGFHGTGGPEVLEVVDLEDPAPREGEILIRAHAAAVNPTDTVGRAGQRAAGNHRPPFVPGMDAAGVVREIGSGTRTDLEVGDAVMAVVVPSGSHGAYSELLAVPADSVVSAPRGADHVEAATLPMNGLTARLALDTLGLSAGDVIAVTGAAGAMGGYVVQLAKADGLTVVADAAEKDEELGRSLGADVVLRRGDGFADLVRERYPDGVDGGVDGALLLERFAPAVRDGGTIITIRGYDEPGERGITFRPILVVDYAREREKLDILREQAEQGIVSLRVADVLPKEQAPEAHRRLEAGGVRGRLVLTF